MSRRRQFRLGLQEQFDLSIKEALFVIEYIKDGGVQRASEISGFSPETGYRYLKQENIQNAITSIMQFRIEDALIDADWHLGELVDNHMIARQQGKIAASNAALLQIGKHKRVDAFAADKIKVSTDADVVDRLVAARKRTRSDDDVSFM